MQRIVIGTAGHIDHGKSSLVKFMTGIDPDRLKEEKERGITIDLGFAHRRLSDGQTLSFIDVPGHERLIRTMVAGVTGIDLVLLVIAADEGVMPQTREHLDILNLLGVQSGMIVLTKTDLVDQELQDLAREDAIQATQGTFLQHAPIYPCSSKSGQGIPALIAALTDAMKSLTQRPSGGVSRLPIDRVFSIRGFGTVITGTLTSGTISSGDIVELLPSHQLVKIRGLQVHGEEQSKASAGQRVAVNLQAVDKGAIERGHQLAAPGKIAVTSLWDAEYRHLPHLEQPLQHRSRIRCLLGTAEVNGVAHILGPDAIYPGEKGFLQLRLDEPLALATHDPFILRLESPLVTLGGGRVLDPKPLKYRSHQREQARSELERLSEQQLEQNLPLWLGRTTLGPVSLEELQQRTGASVEAIRDALRTTAERGEIRALDPDQRFFLSAQRFGLIQGRVLNTLQGFHVENPLKEGMPRSEMRSQFGHIHERILEAVYHHLEATGQLEVRGAMIRLRTHSVTFTPAQDQLLTALTRELFEAGNAPPLLPELCELVKSDSSQVLPLLNYLVTIGQILKIREGFWIDASALENVQEQVRTFFQTHVEMTPQEFKELSGLSRKWAIPLLEYFDKTQVTLRVGDVRKLRKLT